MQVAFYQLVSLWYSLMPYS